MVSSYSVRWALCGDGMKIQREGLKVEKVSNIPDFSVALSGSFGSVPKVQSMEVVFEGDCKYFAVGVAKASVPLDDSLRRLPSGSAWFVLNKGFLCDGKEFEDETLDPLSLGDKISVEFDHMDHTVKFLRDSFVIGEIQDLPDDDLRFCCYMDGTHSSCMIMDKSEDNHVSLDSEDFKELPETYEKYRLLGLKEKEPPVMNDEIVEYKDTNLFQEFPKENVHMSPRDPDESERESMFDCATCLELFPAEHGDKDEAPMQRTDLQDANPEQFVGHGVSRESENKEEAQEHQTKHRQRRAQPRDRGRHEQVDEESRVGVSAHLVKCEACAELSYVRTIIDQITESLRSGQLQDVEKNLSPQTRNKTAKKLQELSSLVLQATGGLSYQSSPLQRAHQDILEQYSALERESEHLRDELSFSKKERQYLSSEVSRLTSRMQTLESSIMRLQMECSQKEEALRNLSGNDLSNDGRLSHPLKSSVSPSVSPSIPRFNDSCDSARKQLDKPAFGLHVEESAPNFGLSPQSHVTPRHSSTSPYADALTSRKDPPFSPDSEAKRKEKINYAMLC